MCLLAPVGALAFLSLLPSIVAAHAELVRAIPDQGATVTEPVTVVTGRYSEDMTGNSHLDVKDASGTTVATGGIDPEDPRRLIARPDTPLTSGAFTVESTTISAQDGDIDRTKWTFTVAAATSSAPATSVPPSSGSPEASSPPPSTTPTASAPSTEPSAAPSPSPSGGSDTSGSSDSSVILPIIAALAIIVIGAAFLLNRSRGSGTAA
jgi:methionine-rich copper-binding protein CopC